MTKEYENMFGDDPVELRRLAENSMSRKDFISGFIFLSQAIRLDPENFSLYTQRVKCFLEEEQFHFALKDSNKMIELRPESTEGYSKKAKVYFETHHYSQALENYLQCFQISRSSEDKERFMESVKRCRKEISKQLRMDAQYPYLGAAVGILVGVTIITTEYILRAESYFPHPLLKVLVVILVSLFGFGLALLIRNHIKKSHAYLLEPPIDLLEQESSSKNKTD